MNWLLLFVLFIVGGIGTLINIGIVFLVLAALGVAILYKTIKDKICENH